LGPQTFDLAFLEDEYMKAKLMATYKGNGKRPTTIANWAWWLERFIGRVMCYSSKLSKQRCKKRVQLIKIHSKKVSLAKIQLLNNPTT
jgi:hypothetical protein